MKKLYLLLLAAGVLAGATAAPNYTIKRSDAPKKDAIQAEASVEDGTEVYAEYDVTESPAFDLRKRNLKDAPAEGQPYYYRPHGTFYLGYNVTEGASLYLPYIYIPNFRDVTWLGNQEGTWTYQIYDRTTKTRPWLIYEGQNLTLSYITESDTVPVFDANGAEFSNFGFYTDGAQTSLISYAHNDLPNRLTTKGYYASPSYWGAKDRDNVASNYLMSGAKDVDGGTSAYWFGKNYSGYNGCAIYCEKPENPYVLRGAALRYRNLVSSEPVDLTIKVYKAVVHEGYNQVGFGELIATGTGTMDAASSETSGYVYFTFTEEDPDLGLVAEIAPEINDAIYVVLSGYDNENIAKMGLPISADRWGEGVGEMGYNLALDEDGNITKVVGLSRFFSSDKYKGYMTPGIFLDVIYPFIINNYTLDEAVRKYDAAGTLIYDGTESLYYGSQFSAYTTNSSDEWDITLADGSDIPEWLTITPEDQFDDDGEFSGVVLVGIAVDPLPEGVAGRRAVVRMSIPGSYKDLTIIQGEELTGDVNQDGSVNAADVTALYNYILNGDQTFIATSDVNGDGAINAGDVTAVYNIILGL